jgi:hypothetical protein
MRSFLLLPLVLLAGCLVTSSFFLTDGRFHQGVHHSDPEVFLDRLPDQPYRAVGIIEVQGPGSMELGSMVNEARAKGGELGCDVVVDRAIHRVAAGEAVHSYALAANQTVYAAPAPPPNKHEFICGLYEAKLERTP